MINSFQLKNFFVMWSVHSNIHFNIFHVSIHIAAYWSIFYEMPDVFRSVPVFLIFSNLSGKEKENVSPKVLFIGLFFAGVILRLL